MTTMIDNATAKDLRERHAAFARASAVLARAKGPGGWMLANPDQAKAEATRARRALESLMREVLTQATGDLIQRLAAEACALYVARMGLDQGEAPESMWDNWEADVHDKLQTALREVCLWPEDQGVEQFEFDYQAHQREVREEAEIRRAEDLHAEGYSTQQATRMARGGGS